MEKQLNRFIRGFGRINGRKLYYQQRHKKRQIQSAREAHNKAQRLKMEKEKFNRNFSSVESFHGEFDGLFSENALISISLCFWSNDTQMAYVAFSNASPEFSPKQLKFVVETTQRFKEAHAKALDEWKLSEFGKSIEPPMLPPSVKKFLMIAERWLRINKQHIYDQNKKVLCEILAGLGYSNFTLPEQWEGNVLTGRKSQLLSQDIQIDLSNLGDIYNISPDTPMIATTGARNSEITIPLKSVVSSYYSRYFRFVKT